VGVVEARAAMAIFNQQAKLKLVIVPFLVICFAFSIASANGAEQYRVPSRCGINAAYLYLSLMGRSLAYDELATSLGEGETPTSLAELKVALSCFGSRASVIRCDPDSLAALPLPAIMHLEAEVNGGHYVVLTTCSDDEVEFIDGSTVGIQRMGKADFCRLWTGYVLCESAESNFISCLLLIWPGLLGGVLVAFCFMMVRNTWKKSEQKF